MTLLRDRGGDDGFTLTEVMITLFIISAVLLGLITLQVKALGSVSLAKERQQASALGNRTMEQLRALPYDTVTAGLRACDVTGDTNVSGGNFRPAYDTAINEPLVTNSTACSGAAQAPLYPHVQNGATTRVGSTQYRVRTYVSRASATSDQGYFLSVLVDWSSANTAGKSKLIAVRSRAFSPTGCSSTSTATRPFAGPCQAFFYSDAGMAPAGITVTSLTAGAPLLTGVDVTRLEAKLPALSTRTQNEQIVSAQSIATTSKLLLATTGDTVAGGQSGSSAADTDPASGAGNSPAGASSVSYSGSSSLTASGTTANFSVSAPGTGSGSAYSTTAATASPACQDDSGTGLVTNQACSSANLTPSGAYRAQMDINLPGGGIRSTDLARINTASSPSAWRAFGARAALPVSGHCASTSDIGCVASGARRSLGAVTVGSLPPIGSGDSATAGFTGSMVSLDGFGATVSSESGISPAAGNATRAGNTLTYWNGTGYSSVTLGSGGATYTLGTAVGSYRVAGFSDVTVTMTGTVLVDPVTTATSGAAPCQTAACTSTSTVGGVRVSVQYDIADGATPLGSFMVTADLGNTIAQTTYKAAPSA
ncbi:MAG TPA: prepilin-type N-terminal cleavage/methylation domain-containing protein [Actinomycetes bacterium]|nr:prepilin-type N-terminal cleavage/methylation domain-containing protein [Actinomycetes bacterium]